MIGDISSRILEAPCRSCWVQDSVARSSNCEHSAGFAAVPYAIPNVACRGFGLRNAALTSHQGGNLLACTRAWFTQAFWGSRIAFEDVRCILPARSTSLKHEAGPAFEEGPKLFRAAHQHACACECRAITGAQARERARAHQAVHMMLP
eukprot:6181282-Pleurochrysis_carterae.AAC.1